MSQEQSRPEPELDIETLRLAYAEVSHRWDLLRERRRNVEAEFAALPLTAGGIFTLFFAFRPDNLPSGLPWLYLGALGPFLLLLYMSIKGLDFMQQPAVVQRNANERKATDKLTEEDMLKHDQWLQNRIIGFRLTAALYEKHFVAPAVMHIRGLGSSLASLSRTSP